MNTESACIDRVISDDHNTESIYQQCGKLGYKPIYYSNKYKYLIGYCIHKRYTTVCCFISEVKPQVLGVYQHGPIMVNELHSPNKGFVISNQGKLDFFWFTQNCVVRDPF